MDEGVDRLLQRDGSQSIENSNLHTDCPRLHPLEGRKWDRLLGEGVVEATIERLRKHGLERLPLRQYESRSQGSLTRLVEGNFCKNDVTLVDRGTKFRRKEVEAAVRQVDGAEQIRCCTLPLNLIQKWPLPCSFGRAQGRVTRGCRSVGGRGCGVGLRFEHGRSALRDSGRRHVALRDSTTARERDEPAYQQPE